MQEAEKKPTDGFQNALSVSWICIKIYQEMLVLFKQS